MNALPFSYEGMCRRFDPATGFRKYSEDQPRDANGRWGSGGGDGAKVYYEVAPNPNDAALTARWNTLTDAEKTTASENVATQVAPGVLRACGLTGEAALQQGGYEGATNPSFAITIDGKPEGAQVLQAASLLGYALSQDSMMVVSAQPFPGGEKCGVITVHVGDASPREVYDELWKLKEGDEHIVGGHSTLNGQMNILNLSGLSDDEFARRIDGQLKGAYQVDTREGYFSFPQSTDYGQNLPAGYAVSEGQSAGESRADRLRSEASQAFEAELSRLGKVSLARLIKFSDDQPRDDAGRWTSLGGALDRIFSDNLGISRGDMPQIPNVFKPKFLAELAASGVKSVPEQAQADALKPSQKDYNLVNVQRLQSREFDPNNPILISREGRVLDGHHRWAVEALRHASIRAVRVDMPIRELIDHAEAFNEREGITHRDAGTADVPAVKFDEGESRDGQGRWTAGGGGDAARVPLAAPGALTASQAEVERQAARQIEADPAAAIRDYEKLPGAMGGRYISADDARELFAGYRADPNRMAAAVQEPASYLTKAVYAQKLAEPPVSNSVVFTAGGAGAGKSTAVQGLDEVRNLANSADVVFDGNMGNARSAITKIDQALATGRDVHIEWIGRDPVDAFVTGVLPRAMATGRTVPLSVHAATHINSAQAIQEVAAHYADNPHVTIHYIDNRHGFGHARIGSSSLPREMNFDRLTERLETAAKDEYSEGRISQGVYEGVTGRAAQGP